MTPWRRTLVAQGAAIVAGSALAAFAATHGAYGWWLFAGVPLLMGFLAVLFDNRAPIAMSLLPLGVSSLLLLLWKVEGIICLAMAAPLAIPLALLGGWLGSRARGNSGQTMLGSCLIAVVPFGVVLAPRGPHPVDFRVSTEMVVNAPPEVVWNFVYSFPDLGAPDEFIFRAGVAAPMGSSMMATGVGAERTCKLSTGLMRERVTVWDPPRLLRFDVLSTPPAMKEMSLYSDLDPPHLHGFYVSKRGEFALRPLPGGRTLVVGTSWYQHGLEPAGYWRWWSDYVVHRVHRRVLRHVKTLAEREADQRGFGKLAGRSIPIRPFGPATLGQ